MSGQAIPFARQTLIHGGERLAPQLDCGFWKAHFELIATQVRLTVQFRQMEMRKEPAEEAALEEAHVAAPFLSQSAT